MADADQVVATEDLAEVRKYINKNYERRLHLLCSQKNGYFKTLEAEITAIDDKGFTVHSMKMQGPYQVAYDTFVIPYSYFAKGTTQEKILQTIEANINFFTRWYDRTFGL